VTSQQSRTALLVTIAGFFVLWLLLDRLAFALGSFRGEWGLAVCFVVVGAAVLLECALSKRSPRDAWRALGFVAPKREAVWWTLALVAVLLCFYPVFALVTHTDIALIPNAALLMAGMAFQGGVAEEVVFRGFLFRRLRETRTFWGAALLSAVPFIAVHALLFLTLDFALALASLLLALSISFPLAWLFERSGNSVWLPALVHAVIQGAIKIVEVSPNMFPAIAMSWMALAALAPWALFAMKPRA
jgi:membrane protease YdiL (CAAX protease family)